VSKKKKAYNAMIADASKTQIAAPELSYQPPKPRRYNPAIGLIGCGGISKTHLAAYKAQGFNVVALCDLDEQRAEDRRAEFFPDAKVYVDYKQVLARDDIEVVDLATHPQDRQALIPAALKAKKHVLSQKPFVLDLDLGEKYVELADKNGVTLAVNQNGRWAPYFSYMRQAINKGLLGETFAAHLSVHWNHEWIRDTHFNRVHHVVLYDFAIHWFDMIHCLLQGRPATRVFSTLTPAGHQLSRPPLLGQTLIEFDGAQASLSFDAVVKVGPFETAYVAGTKATLRSSGNVCGPQTVTLATPKGTASPTLEGNWFNDGFKGSMGELLTSIEKQREPVNSARDNLKSLAICFAAVASADSGKPVKVGSVRKVSKRCMVADE
jgi:predicted dehydrogenase